ncbi:MAG: hypothetical protein HQM10_21045 [Candidatus Riflebacteria bacterium]|nr:hypothetical protein [Candidatus Riflebacteria bacterium]
MRKNKIVFLGVLFCTFILFTVSSLKAEETQASPDSSPQLAAWYSVKGDFLKDHEKESKELLRRIGKAVSTIPELKNSSELAYAGFIKPLHFEKKAPNPFVAQEKWTDEQKALVNKMLETNLDLLEKISKRVPVPEKGYYLKGVADPVSLKSLFEEILKNPPAKLEAKPGQLLKIEQKLLPLLSIAQKAAMAANLTEKGALFQLCFVVSATSTHVLESLKQTGTFETGKFIDTTALFSATQKQIPPSPKEVMQQLSVIPQTEIVKQYLASSGLDLEKDILPTTAQETLVSGNLSPDGEGGFPDIRITSKINDEKAILDMCPKLQDLATKFGFFVSSEEVNGLKIGRLSFFLLPSMRICAAISDGMLIVTTGKDLVVKEVGRIKEIISGKKEGFKLPEGIQRYYRFAPQLLNTQLQAFLQSPLMAEKGIPPIPNLTALDEMDIMSLQTKVYDNIVEIFIEIPFK